MLAFILQRSLRVESNRVVHDSACGYALVYEIITEQLG
jgi:hypothetical protein